MNSFRLKIEEQWIPYTSLSSVVTKEISNEFDRKAIVFCQSWITGRQLFEFSTSGSTGTPKKITFQREQLIASAEMTARALHLQSGNTSLVCLDTDFIAGAMMLVRGMIVGMNMIVRPPSSDPLKNISEHIDFTAMVPYQIIHLLESDRNKFNSISKVIIGGAPLNQETVSSLRSLSTDFYATYGMTETITHIALQKLNGVDRQDYFQLLPGVDISIDDRDCLIIHAPHLSREPIITNDIVSLLARDKFKWIGRHDRVINSGGIKISPEKIEKAIAIIFNELKIKHRFFIGSIADAKLGLQVILIIEGVINEDLTQQITTGLRNSLDKYEVPKKIFSVTQFIETATQKIDQNATIRLLKN